MLAAAAKSPNENNHPSEAIITENRRNWRTAIPPNSVLARGRRREHALSVQYWATNGRQRRTTCETETKPDRRPALDRKAHIFPIPSARTAAALREWPAPPETAAIRYPETTPTRLPARLGRDSTWFPTCPGVMPAAPADRSRSPAAGSSGRHVRPPAGHSTRI